MQGTLILVVGSQVHNLGTRNIPDSGHFRVEVNITPTECDCPPAAPTEPEAGK